MDSPRSGLRRARAASWALAGVGVAAVAGTSALAYADTFKPAATHAPIIVVDPAPPELVPTPVQDVPAPLGPVTTATDPAPPITADPPAAPPPPPTVAQAPVTRETPVPEYTPEYTPQQTYESHAPSTPPTTKRRNLTPTTVMAPNYSPQITVSRGS